MGNRNISAPQDRTETHTQQMHRTSDGLDMGLWREAGKLLAERKGAEQWGEVPVPGKGESEVSL